MIQFIMLLHRGRYDVAWYMAGFYKRLAKIFFFLQLFVAWIIVVASTLYASWDGRNKDNSGDWWVDWWIVSDSIAIDALGETVFALTIVATLLISIESYIKAKARQSLKPSLFNWARRTTTRAGRPRAPNAASRVRSYTTGALATAEVVRRCTRIDHVGVSHARRAVQTRRSAPQRR